MKELVFQVEFLSDIVLPATSNTEGNITQLEFIPGSNFLGMTAKEYANFKDSFKVFHSGKVRFGDATLLVDGKAYKKTPFSLFHPKLEEHEVYHHHFIDDQRRKELGQLKQMRRGYISSDASESLKLAYVDYNYAQKSAYDSISRRSKTSSMYGYSAISAGTKWQFVVSYADSVASEDIVLIQETLLKSKRLGKSKSAQYGEIKITKEGTSENISNAANNTNEVILYAKSRLALVDKEGHATYDLSCIVDGADVVYGKCQIRTSSFTPYNGAMKTKSYERLVIEKGSVIVLQDVSPEQLTSLENGVGGYLAEGFGELLINPSFLMQRDKIAFFEKSKESNKKDKSDEIKELFKNETIQFLVNRHNTGIGKFKLADEVQDFIDKEYPLYKNIKNSQWGTIRSICTAGGENFIYDIKEYISSGKVSWTSKQIDTLLPEKSYSLAFLKLLAMQMPKQEA